MATRRTLSSAAAAALVLGACTDRCPMETAYVEAPQGPTCTATSSISLTVRACEDCRFSNPNCEADLTGQPNEVFLATQWEKCEEDEGCPWATGGDACFTPQCVVTVPNPGDWTIVYLSGTDTQGNPITDEVTIRFGDPSCT
jgi:hypothetical protein